MDDSTPDTQIQPSEQQMFVTLRKLGAADEEAFAFVQGTENMAGQNVIAEIRVQNAKLDAVLETQNTKLDAALEIQNTKLDAQTETIASQQREINSLRWTIGLGFTALGILITVLSLLG